MSNKSGVAKQVISLPTGGGALHGIGETFKPDLFTGTGNLSIPIQLPAGRNGFQPQLNLVYSTGNGNGPFGLGWGVDVPSVSRKTAKGVPRYQDRSDVPLEERDTFVLSGSEDLVQVTVIDGSGIEQFVPRTEGLFAEITRIRSGDDTDFWQVRSKDGLVSLFGTPADSEAEMGGDQRRVIANPHSGRKIFCWMLSETRDTFGNRIEYSYVRDRRRTSREDPPDREWDQLYLGRIRYVDTRTGEFLISVDFVYDEDERKDAFSTYRAGFEIRTRFRCRRIEISTHAAGRTLLREYQLAYLEDTRSEAELRRNPVSLLTGISVIGHDGDVSQALPPLEFGYTALDLADRRFQPLSTPGQRLPEDSLAADDYELIDLFGNGLPEVVEVRNPVRFWRNSGNGQFEEPSAMAASPAGVRLSNPGTLFADLNGNARADLLAFEAKGFFPLTFKGEFSDKVFVKYASIPTLHLEEGNTRFVDLDGDGVTDALLTGESSFFLFFNDGDDGWNRTEERPRGSFDAFPNVSFKNDQVKLGDLSGDGLQDIAFVENGTIHYWPYLGSGRWARRIETKFAPAISDPSAPAGLGFDPRRIHFSDVDGDGLDDLIYVQSEKITIWINQSGSGWSKPKVIEHGLLFDNPEKEADAVRVVDMLGTGTAGILWTFERRPDAQENFQFLDLAGGVKPYLLDVIDNHMGATTRIRYAPSTKFYLADRQDSRRGAGGTKLWKTPLPFPVQVVERVEIIDELSKGKLTSEYRYHHGYWDGTEREFRGFGMVEQLDTEVRTDFNAVGLHGEAHDFEKVSEPQFSPPVLTKNWFHLGDIDDETLEDQGKFPEVGFSEEYFEGDPPLLFRADEQIELLEGLPDHGAKREAIRTLRGSVLRTEMWAPADSARPFTVTETLMGLREVEADLPKRRRVFFPHQLARRTTQWEGGNDPMTSFTFTEDYDEFGQPRRETRIACPRGWRRHEDSLGKSYLATQTRSEFARPKKPDVFIVDRVARLTSFEIPNNGSKTLVETKDDADSGVTLLVIGQTLNFYDGPAFVGLPNGDVGAHGALVRTETLALTEEVLRNAYQPDNLSSDAPAIPPYLDPDGPTEWTDEYPAEFRSHIENLPHIAGYIFHDGDGVTQRGYFASSARNQYDFQVPGASSSRGLLRTVRDPLGRDPIAGESPTHDTQIVYDDFDLLPVMVTDPIGLVTKSRYDPRTLQPVAITDPNDNRTLYSYTPLGLLKDIAVLGKVGEFVGDEEPLADGKSHVVPSTRFEYDFLAFLNSRPEARVPVSVHTIKRVHHISETDVEDVVEREKTVETVEYSDGFGRLLQTRMLAEDDTVGDPIFGGSGLSADQSIDPGEIVLRAQAVDKEPNVVVSGAQVYDNKGRVIEKFEPYFDLEAGLAYQPPAEAQRGQRISMFYEPLGRLIRTRNPDGSEQRVLHGVPGSIRKLDVTTPDVFEPTPWEAYTYDANDLAPLSRGPQTDGSPGPLLTDRAPRHHHLTPSAIVVDALGRTVLSVARNRQAPKRGEESLPPIEEIKIRTEYDIRGNVLTVIDARQREAFTYVYDLLNNTLRMKNIDAGVRRTVFDGAGNEIERRDSKGGVILGACDPLQRPIRLWARDDETSNVTLRERLEYGDGGAPNQRENARKQNSAFNRLGALHRHYDEAGMLEFRRYDFKGNVLEKRRRVIRDEAVLQVFPSRSDPNADWNIRAFRVNWDPLAEQEQALLDERSHETSATYDALNRVKSLLYPRDVEGDRKELRPKYNRAGALESVTLGGESFVEHIAYDAKGQRTCIALGNEVMTLYEYDSRTFRLARMFSTRFSGIGNRTFRPRPLGNVEERKANLHQDFGYDYDLVGNVTRIRDRTPESGILNTLPGPHALDREFEYDAIYRLTTATGREGERPVGQHPDEPFDPLPHGTDLTKTHAYRERYRYDNVGNMEELNHAGLNGRRNGNAFVRSFEHVVGTNQLATVTFGGTKFDYVYDANGNMTDEGSSRHFEWDHSDRTKVFRNQTDAANGLAAEPTVYAHYLYDSSGTRVKKLVRKQHGLLEVTEYIDGIFEFQRASSVENNTLHIMDDRTRIATRHLGPLFPDDAPPELKYHIADRLGHGNVALDPEGAFINREEYTPYGETSFGSFTRKRYRFTGKERDEESGLYYHGARYYAPWRARWVSVDPMAPAEDVSPYCYARDSPLTYSDPTGAQSTKESAEVCDNIDALAFRRKSLAEHIAAGVQPTLAEAEADAELHVAGIELSDEERDFLGTTSGIEFLEGESIGYKERLKLATQANDPLEARFYLRSDENPWGLFSGGGSGSATIGAAPANPIPYKSPEERYQEIYQTGEEIGGMGPGTVPALGSYIINSIRGVSREENLRTSIAVSQAANLGLGFAAAVSAAGGGSGGVPGGGGKGGRASQRVAKNFERWLEKAMPIPGRISKPERDRDPRPAVLRRRPVEEMTQPVRDPPQDGIYR